VENVAKFHSRPYVERSMAFIIAIFTECTHTHPHTHPHTHTHTHTHIYIYIYTYTLIRITWISSALDFTKRGQEIWEIWVEIKLRPEVKS